MASSAARSPPGDVSEGARERAGDPWRIVPVRRGEAEQDLRYGAEQQGERRLDRPLQEVEVADDCRAGECRQHEVDSVRQGAVDQRLRRAVPEEFLVAPEHRPHPGEPHPPERIVAYCDDESAQGECNVGNERRQQHARRRRARDGGPGEPGQQQECLHEPEDGVLKVRFSPEHEGREYLVERLEEDERGDHQRSAPSGTRCPK